MACRSMVATSLPKPRVATIALRNAALMSSSGVNVQLMPIALRFDRLDARDLARHRDIVERRERQRVGQLGAERQAHPAAFEIARDDQRHRRGGVERFEDRALGREIGGRAGA